MDKDHAQYDERANERRPEDEVQSSDDPTRRREGQFDKHSYDNGYVDGKRYVIKKVREILRDTDNDNEGALLQITAVLDKIDVH